MCELVLPNYILKQECTEWVLNKYFLRCNYLLAAHLKHLKIIPRQANRCSENASWPWPCSAIPEPNFQGETIIGIL